MVDRILVPLDGSEKGYQALEYAIENHPDAEITVLHALEISMDSPAEGTVIMMDEGMREAAENRAEDIFAEARQRADAMGYQGEIETITDEGKPKRTIVEHAGDFDAVVMGSYGREGVGQKLLGSVAETVVRRSSAPVTVVR
jgi:nucleotide-binding universal stress UspA family protein